MKSPRILNAYSDIVPSEEVKEKILHNLLASASEISPLGKDARMKQRRFTPVRIAAIVALMVLLVGCAAVISMNIEQLKMGEVLIPARNVTSSEGTQTLEAEQTKDVISLQGIAQTPNQLAAQEWFEFEKAYDPDHTLVIQADNQGFGAPSQYDAYGIYTQEMIDKIDEIAEKYNLKLAGEITLVQAWENNVLFDALGLEKLHHEDDAVQVDYRGGYFYACGNFESEFFLTLTGGQTQWNHETLISLRYCDKEYLDVVYSVLSDADTAQQWNYKTADGTDVLIVTENDSARIFCDREDAFISVDFDTDYLYTDYAEFMTKQDIERIADTIDFSVTVKQPEGNPK